VLLGSSHAEIPLVRAIKELGGECILVSGDPNGLAIPFADEFIECDYSREELVLELCESLHPNAVVAGCNDFAALTASYTAQRLALHGHDTPETAKRIHLKDEFRELAQEVGIRTPAFRRFRTVEDASAYIRDQTNNQMIKPNDLTGGKGISIVEAGIDCNQALQKAFDLSRSGVVVVEDAIPGSLHSAAIMIKDAEIQFLMLADERSLENPFLVSSAETPSQLSADVGSDVGEEISRIAHRLSLVDGLVHVQFIYDGAIPWIIEVCRRPPGDLYLDLVLHSTGFDLAKAYVLQCWGIPVETPLEISEKPVLRQCVMSPHNGRVTAVQWSDQLANSVLERVDLRTLPTEITDFEREKLAILFCRFDSPAATARVSSSIREHIQLAFGS
jgi:biotin carboxylase